MASIEKRQGLNGKPQYRVKIRLKGVATESATFTRKTDATKWAQSTEAAIREGRYFNTSEARRGTTRSPATVSKYLRLLSHVFNVAIKDWEWTNTNPVKNVTKPPIAVVGKPDFGWLLKSQHLKGDLSWSQNYFTF
jgi:hypothetical protein